MMFYKSVLLSFALVSMLSSCKHTAVVPDQPVIGFSTQVQPIIVSNCAKSGCHDGNQRSALYTYDEVLRYVSAGDASNSRLYTDIVNRSMPPSAPLTDEQTRLIYIWIMQGAQNN